MHAKKVLSNSKEKNELAILECWSILKENLKTFLFFSFKIDQHSKITSLFFSFESDKTFLACIFWNAYLLIIGIIEKKVQVITHLLQNKHSKNQITTIMTSAKSFFFQFVIFLHSFLLKLIAKYKKLNWYAVAKIVFSSIIIMIWMIKIDVNIIFFKFSSNLEDLWGHGTRSTSNEEIDRVCSFEPWTLLNNVQRLPEMHSQKRLNYGKYLCLVAILNLYI
jgi:hypothetical protein